MLECFLSAHQFDVRSFYIEEEGKMLHSDAQFDLLQIVFTVHLQNNAVP